MICCVRRGATGSKGTGEGEEKADSSGQLSTGRLGQGQVTSEFAKHKRRVVL